MEIADNLVTAEERLRALLAYLQAMVTKAIRQGAATVLAATQLQIGIAVKVQVVEQGFLSVSKDDASTI